LSQLLQLAARVDGRDFGVLLDVYHLYKGGTPDWALRLVSGQCQSLFHINDYPAVPDRSQIADKDRVFPGDGVAPLSQIFGDLAASGFQGALSLELFNPEYWQREPKWVLETGLIKSRTAWESRLR
jgi:sugar phosphate isomerase/epimerase